MPKAAFSALVLFGAAAGLSAQGVDPVALANNDAPRVWTLTAAGVSPDEAALVAAAGQGSGEVVRALLWRGVSAEVADELGRTPLMGAAAVGRLDLLETLAAAGGDPTRVDRRGEGLVHAAGASPFAEVVGYLARWGLDPEAKSDLGITPLMVACAQGNEAVVRELLARGAEVDDQDWLGRSVLDFAEAGGDPATLTLVQGLARPRPVPGAEGGGDPPL